MIVYQYVVEVALVGIIESRIVKSLKEVKENKCRGFKSTPCTSKIDIQG